ncbi:MAG: PilZ domain-containing protein [Sphingomicrobium sp.]
MAGAQLDRRKAARPDDPEHRGRRANLRAHIVLPASVDALSGHQHTSLLDISRDGACLAGADLPSVGKDVVLKCGAIDTFGTVVWVVADRRGVLFDEPINAKELVALRQIAVAAELSGMTHEERQATADWMSGLAR